MFEPLNNSNHSSRASGRSSLKKSFTAFIHDKIMVSKPEDNTPQVSPRIDNKIENSFLSMRSDYHRKLKRGKSLAIMELTSDDLKPISSK